MMKWFILVISISTPSFAQVANQRQDIIFQENQHASAARASAYAPNVISKCNGSWASGVQIPVIGASVAGTYKDEFCERAELVKLAISMGHDDVADDLFYQFPMIKALSKKEEIKEICDYPTKCTRLGK